jgi:hypothetical protein
MDKTARESPSPIGVACTSRDKGALFYSIPPAARAKLQPCDFSDKLNHLSLIRKEFCAKYG